MNYNKTEIEYIRQSSWDWFKYWKSWESWIKIFQMLLNTDWTIFLDVYLTIFLLKLFYNYKQIHTFLASLEVRVIRISLYE